MAYVSDVRAALPASPRSRLSGVVAWLVSAGEIFAASARVAHAAEANRAPRPADLEKLGIKGPLPRSY